MGDCGSCGTGAGPYSKGRDLVEFVYYAHGGGVKDQPLPNGGLATKCQGCGEPFLLKTFVGKCPKCEGVHAVSPPCCNDPANIQFAGPDFQPPE